MMSTMTHLSRKLVVFVSLLCYLAAASAASAHAFVMMDTGESAPMMASMVIEAESTKENCHSPNTPPCEQSESTACKIFCAAMAQAVAQTTDTIGLDIAPAVSILPFQSAILSRQLSVEPHPPK